MGRHLLPGVDAYTQVVTVMAETVLAAGDYAKLGTGGYVRRAADGVPLALQNAASGVTPLVTPTPLETIGTAWGRTGFSAQIFRSIVALDHGNFAVVYSGNGAQSDTGLNLRIYGALRVPISSRLVVATGVGVVGARLTRAGADNLAIVWTEGAMLKLAIHSATTGGIVASEVAVASLASSDVSNWNVATLSGGDVVVAYCKSGSNDFAFKRFNAAGALQGAEVGVEAGASPTFIGVLALTSGGFVLHYYRYTATAAYKFARFAANGAQQGGLTTLALGSPNRSVSPFERSAMELSNGNLGFVDPGSNTSAAVRLYDAAGNFLSTVLAATGAAGMPNTVCICPRQFGGFWLTVGGQLYEFDNAGNGLRQSSVPSNTPFLLFDRPGTGPLMAVYLAGAFTTHLIGWNTELTMTEGITVDSLGYALSYAWFEVLSNGLVAGVNVGTPSFGAVRLSVSIPQASSILGIAQESAVPGAQVRVATAGKFVTNQSFNGPAFDRRSATPPGTRGVALGNTVILGGLAG
ncbi:hypothetical protein PMI14_01378 [Acidovorax sp. CF316]|uniref:hypothetical protein n=1 Tax=Acidovorax sp. CF316 TaxID=1144317 RepID=UPI00026BCEF0|nr:hypothetical protein [Acidovorax sp. CF316]EJE53726.1 hypothetical protein PMI14_01378 [Acidovorax sp. CF316]